MNKQFLFGQVKAVDSDMKSGEFEVILSAPTLDRDGEVVAEMAFAPLPESVPFHAFHDFSDPIGRATPFYDGQILKARGFYASTPRAQEIRALVADGIIGHTSVGFMNITREERDGVPFITRAELLEGSFVSVPSNRDAAVLMAKSVGDPRPTHLDSQSLHDLAVASGAVCKHAPAATDPEGPPPPPLAAAAVPPADVPVGTGVLALAILAEAEAALALHQ